MACERNRILNLIKYIENNGIKVNIGKNTARGNKGFFKAKNNEFRIDISKTLDDNETFRTLVHEFTHFVHYSYDKKLKSLDFVFKDHSYDEELINLTVDSIPKDTVKPLFETENKYKQNANLYFNRLKSIYPEIKKDIPFKKIEKNIPYDLKYLLKYDKVKILNNFKFNIIQIDDLPDKNIDEDIKNYILMKSSFRNLKKIRAKISRLNRYYNSPTELLARSVEYYVTQPEKMKSKAPALYEYFSNLANTGDIPMLSKLLSMNKN